MKFFCWSVLTWPLQVISAWLPDWQLWPTPVICINPRWPPGTILIIQFLKHLSTYIMDLCKLPEFPNVASLATKLKYRSAKNFTGKTFLGWSLDTWKSNGLIRRMWTCSIQCFNLSQKTFEIPCIINERECFCYILRTHSAYTSWYLRHIPECHDTCV